ncbi:hypothetical protein KSF78_0000498 [Schistosoma japonicum]|nr:hypothetical protein KSF78_0000498 [Schistosoma japonicum]
MILHQFTNRYHSITFMIEYKSRKTLTRKKNLTHPLSSKDRQICTNYTIESNPKYTYRKQFVIKVHRAGIKTNKTV